MQPALADQTIMPVHRYRQARRAFNMYLKAFPEEPVVRSYKRLMAQRVSYWQQRLKAATKHVRIIFFD